jgi:tetratricopeptide (TPR) repeat protein
MAYSDRGDLEAAVVEYQAAIQLSDTYPQTHFNLGNAYREMGEFEKAEAEYRRALELNREFWVAYPALVQVLRQQERYVAAQPYAELLTSVDAQNPQWWVLLGALQLKQDEQEEAEAAFDKAMAVSGYNPQVQQVIEVFLQEANVQEE